MRFLIAALAGATGLARAAEAQNASVSGQVNLKDGGQPLGYTTVSILSESRQLLTNESGKFVLLHIAPGNVRLRFKRIGFGPKDTTIRVAAGESVDLRIEMTRIALQLPAMLVTGKCTNETPSEPQPQVLAELFDQVHQNAERARLLSKQKPFVLHVYRMQGMQRGGRMIPSLADTGMRRVDYLPYVPAKVVSYDSTAGWVFHLPDLLNFADSAFISTHCFRYAGQGRWESDSVIKVDYEPVPWLDKETDIQGTIYLRATDYQLVGTTTSLNRIPRQFWSSQLQALSVHARFGEIVSGIPTLDEWVTTRRYRSNTRVESGQVFRLEWLDSTATKVDTLRLLLRPR
jgi:hypothetical protein